MSSRALWSGIFLSLSQEFGHVTLAKSSKCRARKQEILNGTKFHEFFVTGPLLLLYSVIRLDFNECPSPFHRSSDLPAWNDHQTPGELSTDHVNRKYHLFVPILVVHFYGIMPKSTPDTARSKKYYIQRANCFDTPSTKMPLSFI